MRSKINILYFLLIIISISSCGVQKKSTGLYHKNKGSNSKEYPNSDASDSNVREYGPNKIQNYAKLLGVDTKELNNLDLYYFIDEWMGTPHRMGGQDKRGVDCSGFIGMLYREIYGKDLPRTSRDMAQTIKKKSNAQLKEGDLVFFSFTGRNIDHVGIYLHNGKFAHVSTRKGVIISSIKDTWYAKFLESCGTPKI